ncbi:hypothetical protein ACWD6L_23880 [Micromonospora profundi]|uniref:hypothetical protein n=1 Tax=Micromonospora TaxID=1873 RepID=UPI0006AFA0BA|nr:MULTISPECIES: hypothetical protein [Micromonospora]KOX07418.1 hypothetical protein ADK66_19885 [Micromonospora sp. NRRL B-16802]NJC14010.1 hypothetical protein [Micromonospora profundi]
MPATELDRIDKISSGLGPPIAFASLIVAIGSWWAQRAHSPSWTVSEQEKAVHDHLARRMSRRLTEEANRRELEPPYLQPIRWAGKTRSGSVHDLAEFFSGLSVRQLVILGAAGSGKSSMALRLAIDLLEGDADLIPMIFPVSSWDRTQSLDAWLAAALLRDHPELGDARRFGKGAVACVVVHDCSHLVCHQPFGKVGQRQESFRPAYAPWVARRDKLLVGSGGGEQAGSPPEAT